MTTANDSTHDDDEPVTDRTLAKRAYEMRADIERLVRYSKKNRIDKATADALHVLAAGPDGESLLSTLLGNGYYEGVAYDDDADEPADEPEPEKLAQLRERAHALGFSIASPPDVDCALFELYRERRVAQGTVAEVAEWLREHGANYRLMEVHGCLLGIQAMCTEHDELDGTLLAVVERQARLALEALQQFEIAQKGGAE